VNLLDPLTLATFSAGTGLLLALLTLVFWRTRRTYPGFGQWVIAAGLFVVAMIILAARDWMPVPFYNLAPTLLLPFAMAIANHGTRTYFGITRPDRISQALLALALPAVVVAYFSDVTTMRVVGSLAAGLFSVHAAVTFLRFAPDTLRWPAAACAGTFALFALQRALRIEFYLSPGAETDLLKAVPSSAFNYVINALFAIFWPTSFLFLNVTRIEAELNASRDKLQTLALTDPLTGVRNRRALMDALRQEIARAARSGQAVTLLMVDVDHFKKVNDHHGHLVGDQVLRETASALAGTLRASDVVARFGGEEFAVLLIEVGADEARASAERLRQAVAALEVRAPAGPVKVTASIGIAAERGVEIDLDALLRRADAALYMAKQQGRDRVVAAPEEIR